MTSTGRDACEARLTRLAEPLDAAPPPGDALHDRALEVADYVCAMSLAHGNVSSYVRIQDTLLKLQYARRRARTLVSVLPCSMGSPFDAEIAHGFLRAGSSASSTPSVLDPSFVPEAVLVPDRGAMRKPRSRKSLPTRTGHLEACPSWPLQARYDQGTRRSL